MKSFMVYISWEMLVLYLCVATMYISGTGALVVLLCVRGEAIAAIVLAPLIVVSWAGMLGQVMHVVEASRDMRRFLNRQ